MSHDLGILDITWKSSHLVDHIPNGWVMWNMGTWLMTPVVPRILIRTSTTIQEGNEGMQQANKHTVYRSLSPNFLGLAGFSRCFSPVSLRIFLDFLRSAWNVDVVHVFYFAMFYDFMRGVFYYAAYGFFAALQYDSFEAPNFTVSRATSQNSCSNSFLCQSWLAGLPFWFQAFDCRGRPKTPSLIQISD